MGKKEENKSTTTPQELKHYLITKHGYTRYPTTHVFGDNIHNSEGLEKRFDSTVECLTNNRPAYHITVYYYPVEGKTVYTAEIEVTGEPMEHSWTQMKFYGLTMEQLHKNIGLYERRLCAMWEASLG